MAGFFAALASVAAGTVVAILIGSAILHLIPKLGTAGKRTSDWLCRGVPLDVLVTYFTVLPLFVGPIVAGWAGLIGAVLGQLLGLIAWTLIHELIHRKTYGRAKILRATNRIAGTGNNLFAVFWTAWCVPVFWIVRVAEHFVYPPLTWTAGLPRYDSKHWVAVSRHKFAGLVGHDRIWCLYCDWMTGVWSLGTEMLRNVESFWCPIRFADASKCANCAIDFPDIENGWVAHDGTMDEVEAALQQQYGEQGEVRPRSWFGHPVRGDTTVQVKVNGREVKRETATP